MTGDATAREHLELIKGVVRRDRAAFAALYNRTAPQLLGIALRILRQREEAEDVLQETFVAVWDRASAFDPEKGW
jgi:RNA polymerase sigma-70 factor (ECF subfamily)